MNYGFEIKDFDAGGRLGEFRLGQKELWEIANVNGLSSIHKIKIGDVIYIPPHYIKSEEALLTRMTRFIKENLNYPPKFFAVVDILKKDFPDLNAAILLITKISGMPNAVYLLGKTRVVSIRMIKIMIGKNNFMPNFFICESGSSFRIAFRSTRLTYL